MLLPTIRSRCTPLPLEAVPSAQLVPWLMKKSGADEGKAKLAAELAEGRPGFALSLLEGKGLETRKAILGELLTLKKHGFASVFGVAERLMSAGPDLAETLKNILLLLRDALSMALGLEQPLNRDLITELHAFADRSSPAGLLEAATMVESAIGESGEIYSSQAKSHFVEVLIIGIGKELRRS